MDLRMSEHLKAMMPARSRRCSGTAVRAPNRSRTKGWNQAAVDVGFWAETVNSQPRREADFRREDLVGQGQHSETIWNSRCRPRRNRRVLLGEGQQPVPNRSSMLPNWSRQPSTHQQHSQIPNRRHGADFGTGAAIRCMLRAWASDGNRNLINYRWRGAAPSKVCGASPPVTNSPPWHSSNGKNPFSYWRYAARIERAR